MHAQNSLDIKFISEERFTFDDDCKILLHEMAWSAANPECLVLNAYLDACVNSRKAKQDFGLEKR